MGRGHYTNISAPRTAAVSGEKEKGRIEMRGRVHTNVIVSSSAATSLLHIHMDTFLSVTINKNSGLG